MDRESLQGWLNRYIEVWATYDPEMIGSLFSTDAEYRYHPADEPVRGRDAIVRAWIDPEGGASTRDVPGTYDAQYEPYAVDGDRAVAVGWTRYYTDATRSTVARVYDNCYLLEFDDEGRCRSFTELYVQRPAAEPASAADDG